MRNNTNESGRSMIEIIGVLALMGLITAGVFVLIQSGMKSQRISRTADEIDILVSHARALTAEAGNFKSLPSKDATTTGSTRELKSVRLARNILGKTISTKNTPIGGEYMLYRFDDEGTKFVVGIKEIDNSNDCDNMKHRGYLNGVADCETENEKATLIITYSK